jgi:hypothetical protein
MDEEKDSAFANSLSKDCTTEPKKHNAGPDRHTPGKPKESPLESDYG